MRVCPAAPLPGACSSPDINADIGPTTYTAVLVGPAPATTERVHDNVQSGNTLLGLEPGNYTLAMRGSNENGAGVLGTATAVFTGERAGGWHCSAAVALAAAWLRQTTGSACALLCRNPCCPVSPSLHGF